MQVKVQFDNASPALLHALQELQPARMAARVGPRVQELVETHLANKPANRRGWPSTHFYEKFARNVRWLPAPGGVAIAILPAEINGRVVSLNQRYYGGTISPVTAQALAIPISPVSYGKVPSDFPGLFLLKTPKGAYLVQSGEEISPKSGRFGKRSTKGLGGNNGRRVRASLNFLFKLAASVTQDPDPTVLPSDAQISAVATKAILNN